MIRYLRVLSTGLLLLAVGLLISCRGRAADSTTPTLAPTAGGVVAPLPDAGPTATATPVLPFPAPEGDDTRSGDPTLPTRTPTAEAQTAAGNLPAPICSGLTPDNPEGPFYTPDTPERANLVEAGMPGEVLVLTGYVLGPDCAPIPGAWLDFWHADAQGQYDNSGYRLRGHQFTDASGRYRLETIFPGLYPGRTRHIHVKVMAPSGPVLTTQIYFPAEPQNASDGLYRPELEVRLVPGSGTREAAFDFVVPVP